MELTKENYHSLEAKQEYMGSTQFKDFLECEAAALAEIRGEYVKEKTPSLLVGSYVDAYFSGELEEFKRDNPEIFKKDGTLKADYVQADEIIEFIKKDPKMLDYLTKGENQKIMTGEINGVPFKIKIDCYHPTCIVDQKVMSSLDPAWKKLPDGRNVKMNFALAWGYDIQGAIYREIVRQNVGKQLPFVLAPVTKEKPPRKGLFEIDPDDLDSALEKVKKLAPRFNDIKKGLIEPCRCERCAYCRSTAMVTGIKSFHVLDEDPDELR